MTAVKNAALAANEAYVPKQKQGFLGGVLNEFKASAAYLTKVSLIYGAIGKVKQGLSSVIQEVYKLDAAITKLQIVTIKSRDELKDAIGGYHELASELKVSSETVLQSAEMWLRAGYSIEQSNELIRQSIKLSTLGMMDAQEANSALISVIKGWKLSVSDVESVVDAVTALDSAFATTAGDIAKAMQRGNVSANLGGMSLSDFESYVTAVLDTSQLSAETVGNAFKTVVARMGNVKASKFSGSYNASEGDEEGNGFQALNDAEIVLNKIGIQTRDNASNFRDINEVFGEIAKKWSTLDNVTQNAITTAIAGVRQREAMNVLFNNWDQVERA